jgi:hypothetical protein
MTTSMITHTTTRHMRHIVATMITTIATMGMTTHRIVMNRMSNTATMGIITMLTPILTKAIATTLTLTMPMAIIMARVSPSRRSRPRRLGSWWRR